MNSKLKLAAVFTAGIGCGVLTTYSYFKNKYMKLVDEELDAVCKIMDEQKEKEKKVVEKEGTSIVEMQKRSNELVNYSNITDNYISSVPPNENAIEERLEHMHQKMEDLAEQQHPEEGEGEQYEITSMDWLDDAFFDKIVLTYYVGDDTVANETGLIDDVGMSIGMEEFERFKDSDDVERYIRNPALGIDYNIVKDMGCYHV